MNLDDNIDARLRELLQAVAEDRLDEPGRAELQKLLIEKPQARRTYIEFVTTLAGMRRYLRGKPQFQFDADTDRLEPAATSDSSTSTSASGPLPIPLSDSPTLGEILPSGLSPAQSDPESPGVFGFIADCFRFGSGQAIHPILGIGLIVGVLSLAIFIALPVFQAGPNPAAQAPVGVVGGGPKQPIVPETPLETTSPSKIFIARITDAHNVQWADPDTATNGSELLAIGQKVELSAGLVEIKFDNGAQVLLEGPATFTLDSPSRATLVQGQLTARVPDSAIGFTIKTPSVNVVDLGTEFGVRVSSKGMTDVAVFSGKVIATPPSATVLDEGIPVLADEVRRFWQGSSLEEEPLAAPEFTLSIPKLVKVENAGFESPRIGGWLARQIDGWTVVSTPAWDGAINGGVQLSAPERVQLPPAAEGQQWGFIETRKATDGGVHQTSIYQAVGTLIPNTEYRLRVTIGREIFSPKPTAYPKYPFSDTPHLDIGLWAGTDENQGPTEPLKVLRDPPLRFTPTRNSETVTLTYRSPSVLPPGEQKLFIRLGISGNDWSRVLFDDVQLEAVSLGDF